MAKGNRKTKATPARLLALEVVKQHRVRDAYVRELFDAHRCDTDLSSEDFSYAQVLAFGVCMTRGVLDEAIDRNLNSAKDLKANVRDCLQVSAYELLYLDKPDHVCVDQGVELVKSVAPQAAGFANAVLRKIAADSKSFPWGDDQHDDEAFARMYGVPLWIAHELQRQYGYEEASEILAACLEPAPTYLVENAYVPDMPFASDLSAQFVAGLVPLDGSVLEIGAGRGTKTALLQCRAKLELGHPADIHAVDVHEYKKALLLDRMQQMGIDTVHAYTGDARKLDSLEGLPETFPCVFVDAPCSGTGTLRRHPEIRWKLSTTDVEELATLQLQLLSSAAECVSDGGMLIYATCSILSQENQEVVEAFLATDLGKEFSVLPIAAELVSDQQGWDISEQGFFASVPLSNGPDGHFAACLKRG